MAALTAIAAVGLLAPAGRAESHVFAAFPHPADIVSTPSRLLAVSQDAPNVIVSFDQSGNAATFATLGVGQPDEPYPRNKDIPSLAVSPGLGGFRKGYVYVTQGPNVLQISPDGKQVRPFASIPGCENRVSIAFDEIGTFGYSLLLVDSCSGIWRKGPSTPIERIPYDFIPIEGTDPRLERKLAHNYVGRIEVAPVAFAPFGGNLIIPVPDPAYIFALEPLCAPGGLNCRVPGDPRPQVRELRDKVDDDNVDTYKIPIFNVDFLPDEICMFGEEGAFFMASQVLLESPRTGSNKIFKLSPGIVSQLREFGEAAILTGGTDGVGSEGQTQESPSPIPSISTPSPPPPPRQSIGRLSTNGDKVQVERFQEEKNGEWGHFIGADFAACPEPFTLTAGDLATLEGSSGPKTIEVDVALAQPLVEALEVNYATTDETAAAPADYVPASSALGGPLRFEPGETQKRISLTIVGDVLVEPDETFLLNLTKAGEPATVLAQATVTIRNDDVTLIPSLPTLPQPLRFLEPPGGSSPPQPPPANTPPLTQQAISQAASPPGGKPPPPVPPGPASGSGPALGSLSGAEPGSVAGFSAAPGSSGLAQAPVPFPAAAPGPPALSPQFQPLAHPLAGQKEESPEAAPETDYAMVAQDQPFVTPAAAVAGGALLLAFGCCLLLSDGRRRRLPAWSFGTTVRSIGAEVRPP